MKKRILSLTSLMLSAVLLFTGCGSAKEDAGTAPAGEGTKTESQASDTSADTASDADTKLRDGKMTELRVVFPGGTSSPADLEAVEAGINEIVSQYQELLSELKEK